MFNYRDSDDGENTIRRVINVTDFTRHLINVLIKKQMKACSFFKTPECDRCSYSTRTSEERRASIDHLMVRFKSIPDSADKLINALIWLD